MDETVLAGVDGAEGAAQRLLFCGSRVLGAAVDLTEVGGQQLVALGSEDALGEEAGDAGEESVLAHPHTLGVFGEASAVLPTWLSRGWQA